MGSLGRKNLDDDSQAYRKKKPSSKSKAEKRSDHKHEYELCIIRFMWWFDWGERCRICGRTRIKHKLTNSRNDFLRPESVGKPGVGLNDFLSVRELREKYPGTNVYEELWEGNDLKIQEIFK